MVSQITRYAIGRTVYLPYGAAVEKARDALKAEGFGILTEIDVAATLHQKLGIDMRPYVILGACNPALANVALKAEPDVGVLLPCNVIVYATASPQRSVVAAMDPVAALDLTGNEIIGEVAGEVRQRLIRAIGAIQPA